MLLQTGLHDTKSSTQPFNSSCHVATVRATTKVMVEVHTQIPGWCCSYFMLNGQNNESLLRT